MELNVYRNGIHARYYTISLKLSFGSCNAAERNGTKRTDRSEYIFIFFAWNLYLFLFLFLIFSISLADEPSRSGEQRVLPSCKKAKTWETYLSLEKKEHQIGIRVQTGMTFANDFSPLRARRKRLARPDFYCKYKFVSHALTFEIYTIAVAKHICEWHIHVRTIKLNKILACTLFQLTSTYVYIDRYRLPHKENPINTGQIDTK